MKRFVRKATSPIKRGELDDMRSEILQNEKFEPSSDLSGNAVPTKHQHHNISNGNRPKSSSPPGFDSLKQNGVNHNHAVDPSSPPSSPHQPKIVFHCQQAQGSPTGLISGFTSVKELYQKISECYDNLPHDDILFCTLNTHKVDMTKLLGGQIGLDDFIFVHRKGQAKEIEIEKTENALGLTITDNGAGYSFIKRIKEGSVIDSISYIRVGDHIERIGSTNTVGKRHFEVARLLKEIPLGTKFVMRLVEPLQAGFANIGPRTDPRKGTKRGYGTGKETLRLRANGTAVVEQAPDDFATAGIEKINNLLENFMGINDGDLAAQIWELANGKSNTVEFVEAIDSSDLEMFGFTDDFIFEIWGVVTDARAGRLGRK